MDFQTHLVIGMSMLMRMDMVIQRATEIGVTTITPVFTERSMTNSINGKELPNFNKYDTAQLQLDNLNSHWKNIVDGQSRQCMRRIPPVINPVVTLQEYLANSTDSGVKLIFHSKSIIGFADITSPCDSVILLTGPEKGFTEAEITASSEYNFTPVRLGPRILSCVSAPLTAISIAQYKWGDMC